MENTEMQVTFRGATLNDITSQAAQFLAATTATELTTTKTKKPLKTKTTEAAYVEEGEDLLAEAATEDETDLSMLGEETEDEVEEVKAKPKSLTKAAAPTKKDLMVAVKACVDTHGKKKTLAVLKKKFNVSSLEELEVSQYGAVIKVLKV